MNLVEVDLLVDLAYWAVPTYLTHTGTGRTVSSRLKQARNIQ